MAADKKDSGGDDLKRKFREALEKKKTADHDHPHGDETSAGGGHEESAKTQRMFRRKSG
jgi:hypothetical protein